LKHVDPLRIFDHLQITLRLNSNVPDVNGNTLHEKKKKSAENQLSERIWQFFDT